MERGSKMSSEKAIAIILYCEMIVAQTNMKVMGGG